MKLIIMPHWTLCFGGRLSDQEIASVIYIILQQRSRTCHHSLCETRPRNMQNAAHLDNFFSVVFKYQRFPPDPWCRLTLRAETLRRYDFGEIYESFLSRNRRHTSCCRSRWSPSLIQQSPSHAKTLAEAPPSIARCELRSRIYLGNVGL